MYRETEEGNGGRIEQKKDRREWEEENNGRREGSRNRRMNRGTEGREKAKVGVRKEDRDKQGYTVKDKAWYTYTYLAFLCDSI